ncbi:MAG TPA: hypothetical protein PKD72_12565, partial [Gemmatales bacterium]|nr:hypothetical protein [Gemmatales bacterium]
MRNLTLPSMNVLLLSIVLLHLPVRILQAQEAPWQVFQPARLPQDSRWKPFHLDQPSPFQPAYRTSAEWEKRAAALRLQLKIALGLHPMPEKTPLQAVIHGKRDMGDYTVEKVYFASFPGHYVCGNLYRPQGKAGRLPVVLNPHGHFAEGRFTRESDAVVQRDLESKAEEREAGARFPLQAAAVGLCRLGCIVFHYDMVGYADAAQPIPHMVGFNALPAELRLQSFFGLQTWNSIRALDFVCELPDADTSRIGVTGASGGGEPTFFFSAADPPVDPRPTVSFPAVMVSGNMQGGCICENASLVRLGTNNIEIAALFAPKPQAMTGANDWTRDIETKGLPELRQIYSLYQAADLVDARYYPFPHNYNQVSREMLYRWFNQHLSLGNTGELREREFTPLSAAELSVFDEEHPRPKDWLTPSELQSALQQASDRQIFEKHRDAPEALAALQREVLPVLCGVQLPTRGTTKAHQLGFVKNAEYDLWKGTQTSTSGGEEIPLIALVPPKPRQT